MKRTRRATLLLMAGSGSLLAAETLGFSSAEAGRDVTVEVVDDDDAYLGLQEEMENDGLLFDDERQAPATFDVVNQLPEPVSVSIGVDEFVFTAAEGADVVDESTIVRGTDDDDRLAPGDLIESIQVDFDPDANYSSGEDAVTGSIEIEAEGDATSIEAVRKLTLELPAVVLGTVEFDIEQNGEEGSEFKHEWQLESVDTDGRKLDALRLDYEGISTAEALDFTEASDLSASVSIGDATPEGTIEARDPTSLAIALEPPIAVDGDSVDVVLTGTGPAGSPGGGNEKPSGATVTLICAVVSESAEADWVRNPS